MDEDASDVNRKRFNRMRVLIGRDESLALTSFGGAVVARPRQSLI
jgi:hypothetical protein